MNSTVSTSASSASMPTPTSPATTAWNPTAAGLSASRVLGQPLFTNVAPCMNNFMVAQRFEDAEDEGAALDDTIDYVLTLRMRPVKVKLRLLAAPGGDMRYVLVQRKL
jgi:photoactive yellow protein